MGTTTAMETIAPVERSLWCVERAAVEFATTPIKAKKLIEIDETTISIRFLNKKLLDF